MQILSGSHDGGTQPGSIAARAPLIARLRYAWWWLTGMRSFALPVSVVVHVVFIAAASAFWGTPWQYTSDPQHPIVMSMLETEPAHEMSPVERMPFPLVEDTPILDAREEIIAELQMHEIVVMPTEPLPAPPVGVLVIERQRVEDRDEVPEAAELNETPRAIVLRPVPGNNRPPRYPRQARARGYQGTVVLRLQIRIDGSVAAAMVATSSGHAILDRAAVDAAREWRFAVPSDARAPADGILTTVNAPIVFRLEHVRHASRSTH